MGTSPNFVFDTLNYFLVNLRCSDFGIDSFIGVLITLPLLVIVQQRQVPVVTLVVVCL